MTLRENAAVAEWLESDLPFHSMRDNQYHGVEILGGMWGARLDNGARVKLDGALRKLIKDVRIAIFALIYLADSQKNRPTFREQELSLYV